MTLILSGTDGLSDIDGSAATPAIRGTDANTGIFFPAADTIAFSEGGAEAMRIDSSGNLGIGTTSPSAGLQVAKGSSTIPAAGASTSSACFGNDASDDNYGVVVGANSNGVGYISSQRTDGTATTYNLSIQPNGGNVGIGTTSPSYSLDVSTSSVLTSRIQSSAGETILELDNTNTNGRRFMLISGGNSGSLAGGKFGVFDATAGATRLAIDSSGNVGIGTDSPRTQTHILGTGQLTANITDAGSQGGTLTLSQNSGTAGSGGALLFAALNDAGNYKPQAGIKSLLENGTGQGVGALAFSTRASTSATELTEAMRIDSSGSLLVGRTSASGLGKLNVEGGADFTGGNVLLCRDTGNVGIGTSSPTHKLEIRNDVAATTDLDPTAIKLYNNSDGGSAVEFSNGVGAKSKISFGVTSTGAGTDDTYLGFSTGANGALTERFRIDSSGNTTIAGKLIMGTGASAAATINAYSTTVATNLPSALRVIENTGASNYWDIGSTGGASNILNFYANANVTPKVSITGTGNVGIGTTSPASPTGFGTGGILHLKGSTGNDASIVLEGLSGSGGRQEIGTSGGALQFYRGAATGAMSESMRIDSSGNVGIGQVPTTTRLGITQTGANYCTYLNFPSGGYGMGMNVNTAGSAAFHYYFANGTFVGQVTTGGTTMAWTSASDYRLKENVVTDWDATTRLKQLKPSRFNFISDPDTTMDGFLAHEVQDIVPEAVVGEKDATKADGTPKYQGVDPSKLVPLLVKTIQELEARITTLENA